MLRRERDWNELQQLCKDKEREKAEAEAATAEEERVGRIFSVNQVILLFYP